MHKKEWDQAKGKHPAAVAPFADKTWAAIAGAADQTPTGRGVAALDNLSEDIATLRTALASGQATFDDLSVQAEALGAEMRLTIKLCREGVSK